MSCIIEKLFYPFLFELGKISKIYFYNDLILPLGYSFLVSISFFLGGMIPNVDLFLPLGSSFLVSGSFFLGGMISNVNLYSS